MFQPPQRRQAVSAAQEFNTLLTAHNISVLFCFSWIDLCNIWAHIEKSYVILGKCITQMFGFCVLQSEYASPSVGVTGLELTAHTSRLTLLPDDSVPVGSVYNPSVFLNFSSAKQKSKSVKARCSLIRFFLI